MIRPGWLAILLVGCGAGEDHVAGADAGPAGLPHFADEAALHDYLVRSPPPVPDDCSDCADRPPDRGPPPEGLELGPAEGVQVPAVFQVLGDFLVVLRAGSLHAIDLATRRITHSLPVAVGQGEGTEGLLRFGDRLVLVVHRQAADASRTTELIRFELAGGRLVPRKSHHLDWKRVHSGYQFALRGVDDRLVLYVRLGGHRVLDRRVLPEHREPDAAGTLQTTARLTATDLAYLPEPPEYPLIHLVTVCQVGDTFTCVDTGLVADEVGGLHLSRQALYLWSRWTGSHVHRIALDAPVVQTHAMEGWVVDPHNLMESGGFLHALVSRNHLYEDRRPESWFEYVAVPLDAFAGHDRQRVGELPWRRLAWILDGNIGSDATRWIGDGWISGVIASRVFDPPHFLRVSLRVTDGASEAVEVPQGIDGIEVLPGAVLLLGDEDDHTTLTVFRPGPPAAIGDPLRSDLYYGDIWDRYRGFAARATADGALFGLSTADGLAFFEVDDLSIVPRGHHLAEGCPTEVNQPIFLENRSFGLVGCSLVEVALDNPATVVGAAIALR